MCVNRIGTCLPARIDHWYSHHGHMLALWKQSRQRTIAKEYGGAALTHSCSGGTDFRWPWQSTGTSSLGAVLSGLAMGYAPIVLCGSPLDGSGHHYDAPWLQWKDYGTDGFLDPWKACAKNVFRGRVTSMSGRTRDLLGAPS